MDTNYQSLASILKEVPGAASRIQTILNYHYDAIIRDVTQEIQTLPKDLQEDILDHLTEDMENCWPYDEQEFLNLNNNNE